MYVLNNETLETLRSDRGDGNEHVKKAIGFNRCGRTSDFTHGQIAVASGEATFCVWPISHGELFGSISIDDGNGSENVSFKMNFRFFNLCRVYSNLLKMASVGEFPGVDFLRTALKFRERKRDSSSLVYVLHKTCN